METVERGRLNYFDGRVRGTVGWRREMQTTCAPVWTGNWGDLVGWVGMLTLSPKSRAHTAFFSSRYRQTTVQRHCNSFHCCKCLKQIFAVNRLFGHQTRHHAKCDTELCLAVINAATSEPARDPAERVLFPPFRIVSEQRAAPRCPLLGSDAAGLGAGSA